MARFIGVYRCEFRDIWSVLSIKLTVVYNRHQCRSGVYPYLPPHPPWLFLLCVVLFFEPSILATNQATEICCLVLWYWKCIPLIMQMHFPISITRNTSSAEKFKIIAFSLSLLLFCVDHPLLPTHSVTPVIQILCGFT